MNFNSCIKDRNPSKTALKGKNKRILKLILCVFPLLSGCEHLEKITLFDNIKIGQVKQKPITEEKTPVADQLDIASLKAAEALTKLSRIESTRTPIKGPDANGLIPDILVRPVTISWTGPLQGIAQKLAHMADYDLVLIGKTPASPVIINLNSEDTTLIETFRDIGQQAGTRALLRVDAKRSKVEVIYEN